MAAQAQTYKKHVLGAKRLLYRWILCQKTAISIAEASLSITSFHLITTAAVEPPIVVTSCAHDTILTDALRKPSLLRGINRAAFWARYENLVVDPERDEYPKAAMLIHLEDDAVAARVFRILGSAVSLTGMVAAHFLTF
ncbi:hypothetical protein F4776DRAFT_660688 [Hypoxylon sp. NC0597]|nr:hypothetical protein F4776DRAFT_660688 [Hypoxylon sp. NC0597]